ncbi:MAG: hypothetical protein ABIT96_08050 [Ferruginibacter sp.]
MAKIRNWYEAQSNPAKLLIAFLGNCLFWLLTHTVFLLIWDDMSRSIVYNIFYAIWMGAVWTLVFHWPLVKKVFTRNSTTKEL